MAEATFMGVPRDKIPWFPTIDYDKCTYCMDCDEFCPHHVFERRDEGRAEAGRGQSEQLRCLLQGVREGLRPRRPLVPRQAGDAGADQVAPRRGRRPLTLRVGVEVCR